MNNQLLFEMPVLDEEETKNEVEKVFEEYLMYLKCQVTFYRTEKDRSFICII